MAIDRLKPREAAKAANILQLAVFKIGGEEYAIDIMKIMEIIRPQKVTKIPRAPQFVEGVINLRGKVVPIVDLRKRFGMESEGGDVKKVRVIIVRLGARVLGMVVDEVYEVIYLDAANVEDTPDTVRGMDTEYMTGVGKVGDRLIVILDVDRLLTGEEIRGLAVAEELARMGGKAGHGGTVTR